MIAPNRNFNTISPSAESLLIMKGYTTIPYARQAAELLADKEKRVFDFKNKDLSFWARVVHFEKRYRSIDQLLTELQIKNVLELSSGFSFRGLEMIKQYDLYYIDTDVPEFISKKKTLLFSLMMKILLKEAEWSCSR